MVDKMNPLHSAVTVTLALGLLLSSMPASAATILVPGDQATIQAGINAAATEDTILVAPGTYEETVDFLGKWITPRSEGGGPA